jgi:hypothetical protein
MEKSSTEPGVVIMHLKVPQGDYEQLKRAGKHQFRSANQEALWRLKRSFVRRATLNFDETVAA